MTAFEPIGCRAGDSEELGETLAAAVPSVGRGVTGGAGGLGATGALRHVGGPAGRGPARRSAARRRAVGAPRSETTWREVAQRAGLRPDGSGRVACPFGYANMGSAVRGLLSTGLFDAAITATGQEQVDKEIAEALHPHQRRDGTIWMPNVFRYLIARTA